jgi:hypothetical protein
MSAYSGPEINNDGLVLCLDAANKKSFDPRENLYPHGETLQTLSNSRVTRQSFTTSGPFGRGYQEFTVTETSTEAIYNFDSGNTISLVAGQITTFSTYFRNISLTGGIFLRCWTGAGRAWTTQRQVVYNLVNETSTVSTGTILRHSISNEGGGWYRLSMTVQADQNGFSAISINVGGVIGQQYQASAVQVSNGLALTEYLQTNGAAILRSTAIADISGNNTSGTLVNGVGYENDNGGSLVFDGVNDNVSIASSAPSTVTPITLNVIFNLSANGINAPSSNPIISWGFVRIYARNTTNNIALRADAAAAFQTPSFVLGTGNFNTVNICGTYSGWNGTNYTFTLYVNGEFFSQATTTNIPTANFGYFLGSGGGGVLTGKVNYAAVYTRVLTAVEVQQNFNALRGRFGL